MDSGHGQLRQPSELEAINSLHQKTPSKIIPLKKRTTITQYLNEMPEIKNRLQVDPDSRTILPDTSIPLKKGAFGPPVSPEKAKPTPATMGIKLSDYGSNLLACSFDTLISLQSSEGFWSDAISVFHSFLSPTGSEKLSKLVQDNPKLQPVIFTHYALAILQTQFGSRKDEWDMIHRKAKKWLRQQDVDEDKLGEFDSPVKIML